MMGICNLSSNFYYTYSNQGLVVSHPSANLKVQISTRTLWVHFEQRGLVSLLRPCGFLVEGSVPMLCRENEMGYNSELFIHSFIWVLDSFVLDGRRRWTLLQVYLYVPKFSSVENDFWNIELWTHIFTSKLFGEALARKQKMGNDKMQQYLLQIRKPAKLFNSHTTPGVQSV